MRRIAFYHSADLDGHCSGAIIKYKHPDCELYPINYGDEFPWEAITACDTVYMVDFSLQPWSDMERLISMLGFNLIWIDHHITAIGQYTRCKKQCIAVLDPNKAACELVWKNMFPSFYMPYAVRLLGRYDVWDLKADPNIIPLQYGLRLYETDPNIDMSLWNMIFEDFTITDYLKEGRVVEKYCEMENKKLCDRAAYETVFEGSKVLVINSVMKGSQIFNSIWDNTKYDFMIVFGWIKDKWSVSLYTDKKGVDVSKIAMKYGGGGHKQAAGFTCNKLPFLLI
jgi:oligoribonuclease NrnB/cAMP/cGMP phosphodiesterase (DHH superfamily)